MNTLKSNRGSALFAALIFAAVVAISLGSFLLLAANANKLASHSFHFNAAQDLADTGLEQALWSLNNETNYVYPTNWTTGGFTAWSGHADQYQGTFPSSSSFYSLSGGVTGQVKVYVNYDPVTVTAYALAQGIVTLGDGSKITKTVKADLQPQSLFGGGMVSRRGIDFNGNVMIDSWISGGTAAYSSALRRDQAHISSPSLITVQNADVFGYAAIGTDDNTGISIGATGRVGTFAAGNGYLDPNRVTYDFTANFPDVYPVPTGSAMVAISSDTTLPSGFYSIPSITLSGSDNLTIGVAAAAAIPAHGSQPAVPAVTAVPANVTLIVSGNITAGGGAKIVITPGSRLTIYAAGDVSITGTGGIENGGPDPGGSNPPYYNMNTPASFTLLGTRTASQIVNGWSMQTWNIKGTSYLSAVVNGPNANVSVNGTGDTLGSIVGNLVHMVGSGNFHQDESLGSIRTSGLWQLVKWREIMTATELSSAAIATPLDF